VSGLLIYRASAGSGKTHTLVTSYIKWALQYPDAFKHILTVTFTNAATQEMKQRIITCLYNLSKGKDAMLQKELLQLIGGTQQKLQANSQTLLSSILHQYGDFSVTTIDSFFYKIIQSFSKELGLDEGVSMEMDQELVLEHVVDEVIDALPDKPLLQRALMDFSLHKLLAGNTWDTKKDMLTVGKELFQESFKLYEKSLLQSFQVEHNFISFFRSIQLLLHSFETKMANIGHAALAILEQEDLAIEDFAYGRQGVLGYLLKLSTTKDFKPTPRALTAKDNLNSWYSKKNNPKKNKLQQVVTDLLHPLLVEAVNTYDEGEGTLYRTGIAVNQFIYIFGIISEVVKGIAAYRLKNNVLFPTDVSAILYQVIESNQTPFFYERLGSQFYHFLIDEFQDLSLLQWMNIKPLLQNSVAQGYTNLLVGDVKQSIYRWRGSSWKLLNHQVEEEFKQSTLHTLDINRRSHPVIVWFNNYCFSQASQYVANAIEAKLSVLDKATPCLVREINQFRRVYKDVIQHPSNEPTNKKGYVSLSFFSSNQPITPSELSSDLYTPSPVSWKSFAQSQFITLLEQLKQEGFSAKDIVVLVRNNSEANGIIQSLHDHPGGNVNLYRVRAQYGSTLCNHMAVKVLICALQYLNDENNVVHTTALIQSYHHCMLQQQVLFHDCHRNALQGGNNGIDILPKAFLQQKSVLKNSSIYACIAILIQVFFPGNHKHTTILSFFQSVVWDFQNRGEDTIAALLIWWDKKGKQLQLPNSSQEDVINIMTIHQSKGLAFKVVIMPFCSWDLDHATQKKPILWSNDCKHPPFNSFSVLPLRYEESLKDTYYSKNYYLEHIQTHLDNINLLYVAFTRAKERLYIMAPLPKKTTEMNTIADLLYQLVIPLKTEDINPFKNKKKPLVNFQETQTGVHVWLE